MYKDDGAPLMAEECTEPPCHRPLCSSPEMAKSPSVCVAHIERGTILVLSGYAYRCEDFAPKIARGTAPMLPNSQYALTAHVSSARPDYVSPRVLQSEQASYIRRQSPEHQLLLQYEYTFVD